MTTWWPPVRPIPARDKLGWKPEVDFPTLVRMMVENDLRLEAAKAGLR